MSVVYFQGKLFNTGTYGRITYNIIPETEYDQVSCINSASFSEQNEVRLFLHYFGSNEEIEIKELWILPEININYAELLENLKCRVMTCRIVGHNHQKLNVKKLKNINKMVFSHPVESDDKKELLELMRELYSADIKIDSDWLSDEVLDISDTIRVHSGVDLSVCNKNAENITIPESEFYRINECFAYFTNMKTLAMIICHGDVKLEISDWESVPDLQSIVVEVRALGEIEIDGEVRESILEMVTHNKNLQNLQFECFGENIPDFVFSVESLVGHQQLNYVDGENFETNNENLAEAKRIDQERRTKYIKLAARD